MKVIQEKAIKFKAIISIHSKQTFKNRYKDYRSVTGVLFDDKTSLLIDNLVRFICN